MANNAYAKGTAAMATVFASVHDSTYRAIPEVDGRVNNVEPADHPFTYILQRLQRVDRVGNMLFTMNQQHPIEVDIVLATAIANTTGTTFVFDTTGYVREHDVILNLRTEEQIYCTSVTNTTTIEATRGFNSTAALMDAGDPLLVIAPAAEEGQDKGQLLMRGTESVSARTQHIPHTIGWSDWEALTTKYGVQEDDRLDTQKIAHFNLLREHAMIFNQGGEVTSGSSLPIRQSTGLRSWCRMQNRVSMNGLMSLNGLKRAVQDNGRFVEGGEMWGMTSLDVLNVINELSPITDNERHSPEIDSYGLDIRRLTFTGGYAINLVRNKVLEREYLNAEILTFSWDVLERKVFSPLDPQEQIQTPGAYREEFSIAVNEGLGCSNPFACGIIEDCL